MAETTKKKPFIPPFLEKMGIQTAEWMYTTKPGLRAMMRPNWPLKVRIWACVMLQSFGWSADVAVYGKKREDDEYERNPLTPANIAQELKAEAMRSFREAGIKLTPAQIKELKIDKSNIRRALADMEANDGVLVRVVTTTGAAILQGLSLDQAISRKLVRPLRDLSQDEREMLSNGGGEGDGATGGRVCIYLEARPRLATADALAEFIPVPKQRGGMGSNLTPCPPPLFRLISRLLSRSKLDISAAQLAELEEVKQAIAEYEKILAQTKEAEAQFSEFVISTALRVSVRGENPQVSAAPNPAGQETNPQESTPNRGAAESSSPMGAETAAPSSQPRRRQTPPPPTGSQDEPPQEKLVSRPKGKTAEDLAPLAAAMGKVQINESNAVRQLFHFCRQQAPDCTPEEVAYWAQRKIAVMSGKRVGNWVGYLHTSVPKCFESPGFENWRTEQRAFDEQERKQAGIAQEQQQEYERQQRAEAELTAQIEAVWEEMPADEKAERLKATRQKLKGRSNWTLLTKDQQNAELDLYAKVALRHELEAAKDQQRRVS